MITLMRVAAVTAARKAGEAMVKLAEATAGAGRAKRW